MKQVAATDGPRLNVGTLVTHRQDQVRTSTPVSNTPCSAKWQNNVIRWRMSSTPGGGGGKVTYLIPLRTVIVDKLTVAQTVSKSLGSYRTWNSVTVFTRLMRTTHISYFRLVHLNIIHPFTPRSRKWSLPLRLPGTEFWKHFMSLAYILYDLPTAAS